MGGSSFFFCFRVEDKKDKGFIFFKFCEFYVFWGFELVAIIYVFYGVIKLFEMIGFRVYDSYFCFLYIRNFLGF